jgi:hypothetical protein
MLSPDEEDMIAVKDRDRFVLGVIGGASAGSVGGLCRNFTTAKLIEVVAFLSSMIEMTLSQDTSPFTYSGAKVNKSTGHLLSSVALDVALSLDRLAFPLMITYHRLSQTSSFARFISTNLHHTPRQQSISYTAKNNVHFNVQHKPRQQIVSCTAIKHL